MKKAETQRRFDAEEREKEITEKMIKSIKRRLERGDLISDIAQDMDLSEFEIIRLINK